MASIGAARAGADILLEQARAIRDLVQAGPLVGAQRERLTDLVEELRHAPGPESESVHQLRAALYQAYETALPPSALPHQVRALSAIRQHFATETRGVLQSFCGTGKTAVAIWALEEANPSIATIFAPTILLVKQWRSEHELYAPFSDARVLVICSEADAQDTEEGGAEDIAEMRAQGVAVTTSVDEVARFLDSPGRKVVFSTYHSSPVLGDALRRMGTCSEWAVLDEAQVTASGNHVSLFTHALDDANVPITRRLFMTATPKHYRRRHGQDDLSLVFSMDIEAIYGKRFFSYSARDAIRDGVIVDYQVLATVVDDAAVDVQALRALERGNAHELPRDSLMRLVACAQGLAHAMEETGLRKVITFHRDVRHAQAFQELCRVLPLPALQAAEYLHVNGYQPRSEREDALERLKSAASAVMTNARYLGVGVNIPSVDAVFFVDPVRSEENIIQYAGRPVRRDDRRAPPKTLGHVLVPLFVHVATGETLDEARERGAFSELMNVVESFAEGDPVMADVQRGRSPSSGARSPLAFNFPSGLRLDLVQGIRTMALQELRLPPTFEERLAEYREGLARYRMLPGKEGADRIPVNIADPKLLPLARWLSNALGDWKRCESGLAPHGRMDEARAQQLGSLFGVQSFAEFEALDGSFDAKIEGYREAFARYRQLPGLGRASRIPKTVDHPDFAEWGIWATSTLVAWRRFEAGESTGGRMSAARAEKLKALFGVQSPAELDVQDPWFDQQLEAYRAGLERYRKLPGKQMAHRLPRRNPDPELQKLGIWALTTIHWWRRFEGGERTQGMTQARVDKLKEFFGVQSAAELDAKDPEFDAQLDSYRAGLERYRQLPGKANAPRIPNSTKDPGFKPLAAWWSRTEYAWKRFEAGEDVTGTGMNAARAAKLRTAFGGPAAEDSEERSP